MSAGTIRHYMNIVEGELIPQPMHTLRLAVPTYQMMRTLLHLADPGKYTDSNRYGEEKIMTFSDTLSYLDTKEKLGKFSVPYQEEIAGSTTYWDKELEPETAHVMSPYPSNDRLQSHDGTEPAKSKDSEGHPDETKLSLSEIDPTVWEPRQKRRPLLRETEVKRLPR